MIVSLSARVWFWFWILALIGWVGYEVRHLWLDPTSRIVVGPFA